MTSEFRIREAAPDDARALARIKIAAWAKAYRGIVPDDVLDRHDEDWVTQGFEQRLSSPLGKCFAAYDEAGNPVGFAECGAARDEIPEYTGKLYSIYLHPDCQGQGIGQQLAQRVMLHLHDEGHRSMMLWTFRENHTARRFYEKLGGRVIGERMEEIGGRDIPEVAYGWALGDGHWALSSPAGSPSK